MKVTYLHPAFAKKAPEKSDSILTIVSESFEESYNEHFITRCLEPFLGSPAPAIARTAMLKMAAKLIVKFVTATRK